MKTVVYLAVFLLLSDSAWVCNGSDIFESFFPGASQGSRSSASVRGRATVASSSQARIEGPGTVSTQAKAVIHTTSTSSHAYGSATPTPDEPHGKKKGRRGKRGKRGQKRQEETATGEEPEEVEETVVMETTTTETMTVTEPVSTAMASEEAPSTTAYTMTSSTTRVGTGPEAGSGGVRTRSVDYEQLRRRFFGFPDDDGPDPLES